MIMHCRASLRVETDKNACEIQADLLKSLSLKARIREMYKQSALMEHQTVCQVITGNIKY